MPLQAPCACLQCMRACSIGFTSAARFAALERGLGGAQAAAYSCVHNVLRAHAAAVARFRDVVPHGKISINLNCDFGTPYSASAADKVPTCSASL